MWVRGADELRALVGRDLGPSEWFEVTQEVVDAFGRAVEDWHWAHNDPARAVRGPLGGPIGHAHLTLSLVPHLRKSLVAFATGECMFYGYNRVRFPTAVPVGARVRMRGTVAQVDEVGGADQPPSTSASRSRVTTVRRASRRRSGGTTTSRHPGEPTGVPIVEPRAEEVRCCWCRGSCSAPG